MLHRPLPLALALLLPLAARGQTTLYEFPGKPTSDLSQVAGGHDLNLDGVPDIVTGARFDDTAGADAGAVYVRSGATGALLWWRYGAAAGDNFGTSLAMSPDLDGDGVWEVIVGAPGVNADFGAVYLLSGRTSATLATLAGPWAGGFMGSAVAGDFDLDQDGVPDIAGGAPYADSGGGRMKVWSGVNGAQMSVFSGNLLLGSAMIGGVDLDADGYNDFAFANLNNVWAAPANLSVSIPGALGVSLGRAGDADGNGVDELLVGDWGYDGTFANCGIVYAAQADFTGGSISPLMVGDAAGLGLGIAVAGLGDLEQDGWEDWAFAASNGVSSPGQVRVVSGRFQQELYRISGSPATQYPADVEGLGDVNQDGFLDLAVADSTSQSGNDGIVAVFSAYGPGFVNYCAAGTSANGCEPTLSATGTPSAFQAVPFVLSATGVEGNAPGLFFYGWNGRQANPWGNGSSTQCVVPPVKRAGLLAPAGTTGQCDGQFSQDLNAHWSGNPAKNPGPGVVCQAQLWYRDPQSTSNQTTSMSGALEFYVGF